jgi:hypothetical protein
MADWKYSAGLVAVALVLTGALAWAVPVSDVPVSPAPPAGSPPGAAVGDSTDVLAEIVVEGRGPRFVAPTRRDQIGRIWAPVMINGRGPFRLVLDTGASHSGIIASVATILGLPLDQSPPVLLRGVTGFATVPTVRADSLSIGDLVLNPAVLPIVPDAMGGAQGILGTQGLMDKRIFIDFRHDQITVTFSRDERPGWNFTRVPFRSLRGQLIIVDAYVGETRVKAIIDTGGQTTIANLALRDALARYRFQRKGKPDQIIGATKEIQEGEVIPAPAIRFGAIQIRDSGVTFADMYIFTHWKLTSEPAILIGMDALGTLDTLVIDYRRHELLMRTLENP